ncbi:5-formyltetrahydrofolate cyclo-ligase [Azospirillum doebereinerae]|uniref:5-formyltetrahydrofolate cyclo-ligase n=1 Tax=Azospirillum doebereinerae TaxID=92933 RepID=A0A433J8D3_9PROT|nr:5-formyltetrahydrofolate cyclo-ligase [Azospirillum doebereinerae]MCG5240358.1 5-formyltetrahydrofolate cyclo-ligase [Azospirillum doebereinerae]RUQ70228.1 5-formyltetrahydrofolate cyclo-ligase [Azospirillum doebereinerae]
MTDPYGKGAARIQARAVRDAIADPDTRARAALAIRERVTALPLPDGAVGGYWPFGSELDARPALIHLKRLGRSVGLPVSGPRGTALLFRDWDPDELPLPGRYGILEPGEGRAVLLPSVLLVPLLAFDRTGHRLGYGAGYYDRTLDLLRAAGPVLAVGVAFAAQEIATVPCAEHDERLDWIVTERETLRIGK